jgi:Protein of unknown function (DUF1822)
MTSTIYELENNPLTLPITQSAITKALQFAQQQANPEKAQQVRLNTLAVSVVSDYLQMMDISTDLEKSDSWNPIVRLLSDVADINLPGIGQIECRPVLKGQPWCYVPPETWSDRVGYIVVEIDEEQNFAQLLGFIATVNREQLTLNQLQPIEAFIDHVAQLQQNPVQKALVNLGQWFTGLVGEGWQTLESITSQGDLNPAFAFRSVDTLEANTELFLPQSTITRAKLVNLGILVGNQRIILVVEITPEVNEQIGIRIQLHPTNQSYLPTNLRLSILDNTGSLFLDAQARSADNYIQLQFSGESGEEFIIQISIDGANITEKFVI